MHPFEQALTACLTGRVCLVGIGNPNLGDDSLGMRLVDAIAAQPAARRPGVEILRAGTDPERHLRFLATGGFDHLVFLDAVDCGTPPGTVTLLAAGEIKAQFPPISTHKIPLGVLADYLEGESGARVWLLGVQPAALGSDRTLSSAVRITLEALAELISDLAARSPHPVPGSSHEPLEGRAAVLRRRRMSVKRPAPQQRRPTNKRFKAPKPDGEAKVLSPEPAFSPRPC